MFSYSENNGWARLNGGLVLTLFLYCMYYSISFCRQMRVANIAVAALRKMYGTYYRAGTSSNIICKLRLAFSISKPTDVCVILGHFRCF